MPDYWLPSRRLFTETLLGMMRMTTPHGCEPYVWAHLPTPPRGSAPRTPDAYRKGVAYVDDNGNYHVMIGNSRTMWTSHCDTADDKPTQVNFKWDGDWLYTDGRSILGADDKTGCTIMTMMIRAGVPGHYVFFAGEEVGCIGSKALAEEEIEVGQYDHCVSFDRRGTNSIITHQCGSRTASDLWALDLAGRLAVVDNNLRYEPDPTGVFTDSREFADLIPECTNLSVGYLNQHTARERQDVKFAYDLCIAMIKLVRDGEGLPLPQRELNAKDEDEDNWDYDYKTEAKRWRRLSDPDFLTENEWKACADGMIHQKEDDYGS